MHWKEEHLKKLISKELARKEPNPLILDYYTGTITYEDYLTSDHWKNTKSERLKLSGYACDICGEDEIQLQVHHKHYETLGHEDMDDLATLCPYCHKDVHTEISSLRGKEFKQKIHCMAAEYYVPNLIRYKTNKIIAKAKKNNIKGTPVVSLNIKTKQTRRSKHGSKKRRSTNNAKQQTKRNLYGNKKVDRRVTK